MILRKNFILLCFKIKFYSFLDFLNRFFNTFPSQDLIWFSKFLSVKALKKAAIEQPLVRYEKMQLLKFLSGFPKYHSTETTLFKAQDDIL